MTTSTYAAPSNGEVTVSTKPVSALLLKMSETYEFGKDYALTSKLLARAAKPGLQFIETRASSLKKLSPIDLDGGVSTLDSKLASVISYGQEKKELVSAKIDSAKEGPSKIKQGTLHLLRDQIIRLNKEEQKNVDDEDLAVSDLLNEGRSIAMQQFTAVANKPTIVKVSTKATETVDSLIGGTENYLEKYIPATEADAEQQLVAKDEDESRAARSIKLSKVAAYRVKAQTLSKLTALRLRTVAVVPVDLVKYSKLLDIELLKGKVSPVVQSFRDTVTLRVVDPVKSVTVATKERVSGLKTAVRMYKDASVSVAMDSLGPIKERFVVPAKVSYLMAQLQETFNAEVSKQKKIRGEEDDSKLTIRAGLTALVLTGRARIAQEYDLRVAPIVAKVTGKKTDVPVATVAAPVAAVIVEEDSSEDSDE